MERWRRCKVIYKGELVRFFNYAISDTGRVRNFINGNIMNTGHTKYGYVSVTLTNDCGCYSILVHRLVAHAFIGPCPEGMEVNHEDGIKSHNYAKNLEYKSHSLNIKHAIDNGLISQIGCNHTQSKFKESDIFEIFELASNPRITTDDIADKFGVSKRTIYRLVGGHSYQHGLGV